jgi:hypothetical protein
MMTSLQTKLKKGSLRKETVMKITYLLVSQALVDTYYRQGRRERVRAPVKTFFSAPRPSKGEQAKNLYTKPERLTLSCRVTWAWSERVNL